MTQSESRSTTWLEEALWIAFSKCHEKAPSKALFGVRRCKVHENNPPLATPSFASCLHIGLPFYRLKSIVQEKKRAVVFHQVYRTPHLVLLELSWTELTQAPSDVIQVPVEKNFDSLLKDAQKQSLMKERDAFSWKMTRTCLNENCAIAYNFDLSPIINRHEPFRQLIVTQRKLLPLIYNRLVLCQKGKICTTIVFFLFSIQRFSIIPLSTNTGLIGWVPNSDTLHSLIREYRDKTDITLNQEHREMLHLAPDFDRLNLSQKTEVFEAGLRVSSGRDLANILWLKSHNSEVCSGPIHAPLISHL